MTCDDFRKTILTPKSFTNSTRAERASMVRHRETCEDCHSWLMTKALKRFKNDPRGFLLRAAQGVVVGLMDADDPEFRDVVDGPF